MTRFLEQFAGDARLALRQLVKAPAFSLLAILSLALGMMATTAIYSVLHAVVLDPFPYKDVDRLMSVRVANAAARGSRTYYNVDQFLEFRERATIFDGVIASTISDVLWTGNGDPQRLRGNHGTFDTFDVMGVPPLLGRTPRPEEAQPGATPVVVLGYRFWQRQFAGDPNVIGRELRLNDTVRTVIGVMPKRFMWRGADVYLPTTFVRGQNVEGVRTVHLLGRLKPGVTEAQAETDLAPIVTDLKKQFPTEFPDQWRVGLLPFTETFPSGIAGDIWVLFGAVALLLLIACANVSHLLLSRATARQREMAVRAALGASGGRLVRQLLTESLVHALLGGAVGIALAYAALPALMAIVPPDTIPDESDIRINIPVLLFTLAAATVTSVICGLAPALNARGSDLARTMREVSRGVVGSVRQARFRNGLVVLEVALSLVLLSGASLLVRTYAALQKVELGVAPERVLTMRVPLPQTRYPDATRRVAFFRDLLDRLGRAPGVTAAAVNTGLHPIGNLWANVDVTGGTASGDPVAVHNISSGYPAVFGIRLASGRLLTNADTDTNARTALVNERFVRMRLDGREPLGQTVHIPRLKQPPFNLADDSFQIVGVVHDTPNQGLSRPVMPELYLPYTAAGVSEVLVIRAEGDPSSLVRAAINQVHALDPNQPVTSVKTLETLLSEEELATYRFNLVLIGFFAFLGLTLATVGVYGVISTAVARQTHEIGVRMALGADAGRIARMVVVNASRLLLAGIVLGLAASVIAARMLAQQVWNVAAFDPAAFAAVSIVLLGAGLPAALWPAWRAARIDPTVALRQE